MNNIDRHTPKALQPQKAESLSSVNIITEIIEILSSTERLALRYQTTISDLINQKENLKDQTIRLGIIGVTSSGKSTLINALLGEKLLPAKAKPSTSQLVSCKNASIRKAIVYFFDTAPKELKGGKLKAATIEKYGEESSNPQNREKVTQIEIQTPNIQIDRRIVLIDSPGLDAFGFPGHEELTMNTLLPSLDMCIFVTTCKTNSDEKTLSVLNTIAEYQKPVIIVQNMIDSIRRSPDGKKSKIDIANEHKRRLAKIINESNIIDKSSVQIIQISAINALDGRITNNVRLLRKSNYEILIKAIESYVNTIMPQIEANRCGQIKRLLNEIVQRDSINTNAVVRKEIDCNAFVKQTHNILNETATKVEKLLYSYEYDVKSLLSSDFEEDIIQDVQSISSNCKSKIGELQKSIYRKILKIANDLNMDTRGLFATSRFPNLSNITLKYSYDPIKKKKSGFWNGVKRFFGAESGYETEVVQSLDRNRTRQSLIASVQGDRKAIKETIADWISVIDRLRDQIFRKIDLIEREQEERKKIAVEREELDRALSKLKALAANIKNFTSSPTMAQCSSTDLSTNDLTKVECPHAIKDIFELADRLSYFISRNTISSFMKATCANSRRRIIVGWDILSEASLLKRFLGENLSLDRHKDEMINIADDWSVIHHPSNLALKNLNKFSLFILINSIQFGAALNQLRHNIIKQLIDKCDQLIFVIQDLQEIINGKSLNETIDNMLSIKRVLGLNQRCYILVNHTNPIYNIALAECQVNPPQTQKEETMILHKIRENFGYLIDKDTEIALGHIIRKFNPNGK